MPVRTSHTSASAASRLPAAERTVSEDVRVNRPSPFTARVRPCSPSGRSTSLRTPAAPMVMVRSADRPALPSGVTVTSPVPWPAAAHTESRSVSSTPA